MTDGRNPAEQVHMVFERLTLKKIAPASSAWATRAATRSAFLGSSPCVLPSPPAVGAAGLAYAVDGGGGVPISWQFWQWFGEVQRRLRCCEGGKDAAAALRAGLDPTYAWMLGGQIGMKMQAAATHGCHGHRWREPRGVVNSSAEARNNSSLPCQEWRSAHTQSERPPPVASPSGAAQLVDDWEVEIQPESV